MLLEVFPSDAVILLKCALFFPQILLVPVTEWSNEHPKSIGHSLRSGKSKENV